MGEAEGAATSEWQRRVEGTWRGLPVVHTPEGEFLGHVRVARTVRMGEGGEPEIHVTNDCDFTGPVHDFIGAPELVLRAKDTPAGRVYDGRDFHGSGRPYGRLLVGQDFITEWGLDTVVTVQVLPDGHTQLYSNLAYDGPDLVCVLGGLYELGPDDLEAYEARERAAAQLDFAWPDATWTGEVEVHDGTDGRTEPMSVTHRDGRLTITGGGLDRAVEASIERTGHREVYAGPDVFGNARAYGPMNFGTRHVRGVPLRIQTREVLLDGGARLAIAWQHWLSGERVLVVNGVLERAEG